MPRKKSRAPDTLYSRNMLLIVPFRNGTAIHGVFRQQWQRSAVRRTDGQRDQLDRKFQRWRPR